MENINIITHTPGGQDKKARENVKDRRKVRAIEKGLKLPDIEKKIKELRGKK